MLLDTQKRRMGTSSFTTRTLWIMLISSKLQPLPLVPKTSFRSHNTVEGGWLLLYSLSYVRFIAVNRTNNMLLLPHMVAPICHLLTEPVFLGIKALFAVKSLLLWLLSSQMQKNLKAAHLKPDLSSYSAPRYFRFHQSSENVYKNGRKVCVWI